MKKILIGAVVVLVLGALVVRQLPEGARGQGDQGLRGGGLAARPGTGGQGERRDRAAGQGQHLGPRGRQDRAHLRRGGGHDPQGPALPRAGEGGLHRLPRPARGAAPRAPRPTSGRPRCRSPTRARSCRGRGASTKRGSSPTSSLEDAAARRGHRPLRLEDAREAVRQAQATLEKARDDLAKTTIYAPLTGRVVRLNAEEGEVVVSGTMNNAGSVIAEIADLSEILANVDVDETEVVLIRPGQPAVIRVDAMPEPRVPRPGGRGRKLRLQPPAAARRHLLQGRDPARGPRRRPAAGHVAARRDRDRDPLRRCWWCRSRPWSSATRRRRTLWKRTGMKTLARSCSWSRTEGPRSGR